MHASKRNCPCWKEKFDLTSVVSLRLKGLFPCGCKQGGMPVCQVLGLRVYVLSAASELTCWNKHHKKHPLWTYQPLEMTNIFYHFVWGMQTFHLDSGRISLPKEWLLNPEIKLKFKRYLGLISSFSNSFVAFYR